MIRTHLITRPEEGILKRTHQGYFEMQRCRGGDGDVKNQNIGKKNQKELEILKYRLNREKNIEEQEISKEDSKV